MLPIAAWTCERAKQDPPHGPPLGSTGSLIPAARSTATTLAPLWSSLAASCLEIPFARIKSATGKRHRDYSSSRDADADIDLVVFTLCHCRILRYYWHV